VGNPGNLPDPATAVPAVAESGVALLLSKLLNAQSGIEYGRVDYSYEIGKYDVTVTQYTASAYGTYDQNGNVSQWNDSIVGIVKNGTKCRGWRGGSWSSWPVLLGSDGAALNYTPQYEGSDTGFRVATGPSTGR